jgi:hypothetical protein
LLNFEIGRRSAYLIMFLLTAPRVIASAGTNHPAVVMFVWSALALLFASKHRRIPRAIVRRPRRARLRTWTDAVLLRVGELPLSSGHTLLPWRLTGLDGSREIAALHDGDTAKPAT